MLILLLLDILTFTLTVNQSRLIQVLVVWAVEWFMWFKKKSQTITASEY